jgi:hypothetical protein
MERGEGEGADTERVRIKILVGGGYLKSGPKLNVTSAPM